MRLLLSVVLLLALTMPPEHAWSGEAKETPEVGVRKLMKNPETYSRKIQVAGVVSQVSAESKIFGMIDVEEFKTCQKLTCASLILPVRWEGIMPEIGQQLNVVGEIQKNGDHYLFSASDLVLVSGN